MSGFNALQGNGIQVDHIHPFRLGGKNSLTNLRVTDNLSNPYTDSMHGSSEKPAKREKW